MGTASTASSTPASRRVLVALVPLALFIALVALLVFGLGNDPDNSVGIHWGVYGAPETVVVDRKGIIRYKHIGAPERTVWEETSQPLVAELQTEG